MRSRPGSWETIPPEVYNAKYTALQNEKAAILREVAAQKRANEHYLDEMETLLLSAHRPSAVFAAGGPERKLAVLRIVASNGVLKCGKARPNLRPALSLLTKIGPRTNWLGIIRELRTALKDSPLLVEVLKELLGNAA